MHGGPDTHQGQDLLSLAEILNILWRRRAMIIAITLLGLVAGVVYGVVTKPLYRSTATVRPGITGYLANGNPERDWRLKDIVRWYQRGLFGEGLREAMGWPGDRRAPLIQAEFIPRGVGIQGGNVVTLTYLHTDTDEAERVLEATVDVFNAYADSSSVGDRVSLARKSIQSEIDKIANDRDNISIKRDLLNIEIVKAKRDLEAVKVEEQKLDLAIREHAVSQRHDEALAGLLEGDVEGVSEGLSEMDYFLERMRDKELRQGERDSLLAQVPAVDQLPFLWWEMAQDKTAVTARLLMSYLQLQTEMWDESQEALDLRFQKESTALKKEADFLITRFDLANRREMVELHVQEMEINRDRTLEQELLDLEDEIRILQARLDVLSPLERIGVVESSLGPVRPRKARAAALLMLAAFVGAVCLAFALEYLVVNRRVIFSSGRREA